MVDEYDVLLVRSNVFFEGRTRGRKKHLQSLIVIRLRYLFALTGEKLNGPKHVLYRENKAVGIIRKEENTRASIMCVIMFLFTGKEE